MPGDIIAISHNIACHAMTARVISVDTHCWEGMAFLQVYELDAKRQAVEKRMAYVAVATVTLLHRPGPVCTCPFTSLPYEHRLECRRRHLFRDHQAAIDDRLKQQAARGLKPNTRPAAIPRPRRPATTTTTIPTGGTR